MEKIIVTGGTGLLGSEVVRQLLSRGLKVGVLSSQIEPVAPGEVEVFQGDLRSGAGLSEVLVEARVVIHCASNFSSFTDTDIGGTANLLKAIDMARLPHLVYISIVGVDDSSYPYYVAKRAVEEMILASGVPCTILRTTQFHDFVLNMIRQVLDGGDEVALVPDGIRFQSVDIREVAQELIRVGLSEPGGLLAEFGGPEVWRLEEMFEEFLRVSGIVREWKAYPVAGLRYDNFRTGVNIVADRRCGKVTWTEYLRSL